MGSSVNSHANATRMGGFCGRLTYDLPLGCLQGGFFPHPQHSSTWPNVAPTFLAQVSFTLLLINETEGLNKDFQEALVRSQGLSVLRVGTVLDLRTTTSQKCEAVPRRARI